MRETERESETGEKHGDLCLSVSSIRLLCPQGGSVFQNARRDRVACYQNERQPLKVCFLFFIFLKSFKKQLPVWNMQSVYKDNGWRQVGALSVFALLNIYQSTLA